jgi:NAD(P)H-dependent FMN reductase
METRQPIHVLVISASFRRESLNDRLARLAGIAFEKHGATVDHAQLRDFDCVSYDLDIETESGVPDPANRFCERLAAADAFVIASPEYNGSYSAVLKNAIDWISRPEPGERALEVFSGKPAAILSASPGAGGGRRVLKQLRELLEGIRMTVVPHQVSIAQSGDAFDVEGRLKRPADIESLNRLTEELAGAVKQKATA